MHPGVKLRHIRAFLDIAEEGNVSAAARRQGISQPALSKTLAELEAMTGTALFTRQGRRVLPTSEGALFRRHALQAMQQLETGFLAASGGAAPGRLTVGLLPTVAGGIFPRAALGLSRRNPGLQLSMITGPNIHLLARLRDGELDLMVGRMPAADDMPGLRFDFLYQEELLLVGRAGHPLAGSEAVAALRGSELILPTKTAIIRPVVEEFLLAAGLGEPAVRFETEALTPALGLLEGSDMVWMISRGVVRREIEEGRLITFPFRRPFLSGAVGLTMRQSMADRPEVLALSEALHHEVRHAPDLAAAEPTDAAG